MLPRHIEEYKLDVYSECVATQHAPLEEGETKTKWGSIHEWGVSLITGQSTTNHSSFIIQRNVTVYLPTASLEAWIGSLPAAPVRFGAGSRQRQDPGWRQNTFVSKLVPKPTTKPKAEGWNPWKQSPKWCFRLLGSWRATVQWNSERILCRHRVPKGASDRQETTFHWRLLRPNSRTLEVRTLWKWSRRLYRVGSTSLCNSHGQTGGFVVVAQPVWFSRNRHQEKVLSLNWNPKRARS